MSAGKRLSLVWHSLVRDDSSGLVVLQNILDTVKRPKFGNGPLVRHPLSKLLKNHISAVTEVSDLVQRGERLYIFF
jgi:hypothetical protein